MWKSLVIAAALAMTADAAPLEIAVIDMKQAFRAHPETAKAESRLRAERSKARKEADAKAKELKDLLHQHQQVTSKLVAAGVNPDDALRQQAEQLLEKASTLEVELAELRTTRERDLRRKFLAERRRILGEIADAVGKYNEEGRFALVLDRSAASSNGLPQVIHAPGATDITRQIVATFGRR